MGACKALNCSNSSTKKFRMFRFPVNEERRRKWIENFGRSGWVPAVRDELCSVHFEDSEYEQHRADGKKKLKTNAVPTIFYSLNPSAPVTKSGTKRKYRKICEPASACPTVKSNEILVENSQPQQQHADNCETLKSNAPSPSSDNPSVHSIIISTGSKDPQNHKPVQESPTVEYNQIHAEDPQYQQLVSECSQIINDSLIVKNAQLEEEVEKLKLEMSQLKLQLEEEIKTLQTESKKLKLEIEEKKKCLSFLSPEQISVAAAGKSVYHLWTNEGISKGLKLRFVLGKFGYSFLRSTGYPIPSYSTLNRRIRGIPIHFGVLHELLPLLKIKIESMDPPDKMCALNTL